MDQNTELVMFCD